MAVSLQKRRGDLVLYAGRQKRRRVEIDWSKLPDDVVTKIVEDHIVSIEDYAAVSAVSRSWRRSVASCHGHKLRKIWTRQMPWLMLTDGNDEPYSFVPIDSDDEEEITYYTPLELEMEIEKDRREKELEGNIDITNDRIHMRDLFDLSRNKSYSVSCPEGYNKVCWGSGHGWIVTTGLDHDMYLFNPLTKCRLSLPSRLTFHNLMKVDNMFLRQFFIDKVVVLKVPGEFCGSTDDDEVILVVVLYNDSNVAFAKPGDTRWTPIKWANPRGAKYLHDVLFRPDKGVLLFVSRNGFLIYCNLKEQEQKPLLLQEYVPQLPELLLPMEHPSETLEEFDPDCGNDIGYDYKTYLANHGNDLLLVLRKVEYCEKGFHTSTYKTCSFRVFMMDIGDTSRWKELQDLFDLALFVGNSSTMCVNALEAGCKSNCVYFTDDYTKDYRGCEFKFGGHDIGVFNLADKSIDPVCKMSNLTSSYCCPIWFVPSL